MERSETMRDIACIQTPEGLYVLREQDRWFFWWAAVPRTPKQGRSFRYPHKAMVWGCDRWWDEAHPMVALDPHYLAECRVQVIDDGKPCILRLLNIGGARLRWFNDEVTRPVTDKTHTNLTDAINYVYRIWGFRPIVAI
jgi:hypothetical protein